MKKLIHIATICLFLMSVNLFSSSIQIPLKQGWNLKGISEGLDDMVMFNNVCVEAVFSYDNEWKQFAQSTESTSLNKINKYDGFWVKALYDCILSINSPIVGSWYIGDNTKEDAIAIITFFPNGTYAMFQDGDSNQDPSGQDGIERGIYTWNETTEEFHILAITDTNGEWGFNNSNSNITATIENDTLKISTSSEEEILYKTEKIDNSIIGSWYIGDNTKDDSIAIITFFSNGTYAMFQDGDSNQDPSGQDGIERGTYTWNETTGEFYVSATIDMNGNWGLSSLNNNVIAKIENNTLKISVPNEGETIFYNIEQ